MIVWQGVILHTAMVLPVYNAGPYFPLENVGQNSAHYTRPNTVFPSLRSGRVAFREGDWTAFSQSHTPLAWLHPHPSGGPVSRRQQALRGQRRAEVTK